jgi:hypothetical protein
VKEERKVYLVWDSVANHHCPHPFATREGAEKWATTRFGESGWEVQGFRVRP